VFFTAPPAPAGAQFHQKGIPMPENFTGPISRRSLLAMMGAAPAAAALVVWAADRLIKRR